MIGIGKSTEQNSKHLNKKDMYYAILDYSKKEGMSLIKKEEYLEGNIMFKGSYEQVYSYVFGDGKWIF